MQKRDRSKLTAEKLIELICQVPEPQPVGDIQTIANEMAEIRNLVALNKMEITTMKIEKTELIKKNASLTAEIELLKVHARECVQHRKENPTPPTLDYAEEIEKLKDEVNSIQQYLRVNNLEIVGLPAPNNGESEETLIINALNELVGLDDPVGPEDIDISHPLPSKRKDNKPVHVVRFVSRKTKFAILAAKKRDENRQFKFRNNDVYINEHLSKSNRELFALTQDKKRTLNYKHCWTRGGSIFLRKTDDTDVITISKKSDFDTLQWAIWCVFVTTKVLTPKHWKKCNSDIGLSMTYRSSKAIFAIL